MNLSRHAEKFGTRSAAEWMPASAGLLVAAGLAWWACPAPPPQLLSWDGLLISAVLYVLMVFLAGAGVLWIGYALVPRRTLFDSWDVAVRIAIGAAWFAPLVIFGLLRSVWVVGIAVVAAVTVTRAFRFFSAVSTENDVPKRALAVGEKLPAKMFQAADPVSPVRPLLSRFFASICAQAGVVVAVAGYKLTAAILLGIATAMLAWSWPSTATRSRRPKLRMSLVLALAILLTAGSLAPFLKDQRSLGLAASGVRALLQSIFQSKGVQPSAPPPSADLKDGQAGGTYKGVILWPEEPRAIILAPRPPEMSSDFFMLSQDSPLSMPFHGVYWFFKVPDRRPPEHSYKVRGSPEKMGLHSSDEYPLLMEAHQNFSSVIDLNCCGRIQVAIRNADRRPGTVSLELQLRNRTLAAKPYISLGRIAVASKLPDRAEDDAPPVEEVVSFNVPATASIRYFDEMTILFRLNPERAGTSARIAIDHFVFLPRRR